MNLGIGKKLSSIGLGSIFSKKTNVEPKDNDSQETCLMSVGYAMNNALEKVAGKEYPYLDKNSTNIAITPEKKDELFEKTLDKTPREIKKLSGGRTFSKKTQAVFDGMEGAEKREMFDAIFDKNRDIKLVVSEESAQKPAI